MRTLCVIPVRGGSKGIPRKNVAVLFDEVTLLEWTILQAQAVYGADEVIVSTEDKQMMDIASQMGANVHQRSADLAKDSTSTASVVHQLTAETDQAGQCFDVIAILQVTSPLREADDLRSANTMMKSGLYDSVVSAYSEELTHPAKMYFKEGDIARPVLPEMEGHRRQDLPPVFRRNGAIFMATKQYFDRTGQLWGGRTGLVEMPRERSIDVDGPEDLAAARQYFIQYPSKKNQPEPKQ